MENQFNAGDLVWAKVHRHPWWPSIIYHEALTSIETQQAKKEGFVLVSFFGDSSYKWLGSKQLLHFESNYNEYSKRCKSRLFVKAVDEAVYEVNYRAALGLTCCCSFFSHYRPSPVDGLIEVDIDGYKLGGVVTVQQIEHLRQEFQPVETVSFLHQLALDSTNVHQDLKHSKEVARVLAFRKANYAEIDEPYFHAFGVDPRRLGVPIVASDDQETALIQAPTDQPSEAEIQAQNIAKVERQNENKRCLAPQKVKGHVTKTKCLVKRNKHHDPNNQSSPDNLAKKKRHTKVEVDEKLVKREHSPSPSREPSILKEDDKKFKSSTTTKMFNDVDFVQSSEIFTPSKTCHAHKDSSTASRPFKNGKRKRSSASIGEVQESRLTLSPQNKGKTVKKHQEGPKMMLSIKFPQGTALPSVSELKAKFARFGPLDTSGIRVSWSKSRCQVVFMNTGDAEEAYEQAVTIKNLFAPNVTYQLCSLVSRSNLHEGSVSEENVARNLQNKEAPVTSCSAHVRQVQHRDEEIHAKYREQTNQICVQVNQGGIDISQKMLHLLNECNLIVQELKSL